MPKSVGHQNISIRLPLMEWTKYPRYEHRQPLESHVTLREPTEIDAYCKETGIGCLNLGKEKFPHK